MLVKVQLINYKNKKKSIDVETNSKLLSHDYGMVVEIRAVSLIPKDKNINFWCKTWVTNCISFIIMFEFNIIFNPGALLTDLEMT